MTSRELVWLLLRRWYLLLLGAALTLGATYGVLQRPGVYWTSYEVVLLAPTERYYVNNLEDPHYEIAALAGVFVREWNGAHTPDLTASSDTRLYGEGETSAVRVRMANQGSQWKPLYPAAVIDVEVVDPSADVVAARAATTRAEIEELLTRVQDEAGVSASWRIEPLVSPAAPEVTHHGGSRARALGAMGVLGVSVTITAMWWIDRRLLRRRGSRRAAPAPAPAPEVAGTWTVPA